MVVLNCSLPGLTFNAIEIACVCCFVLCWTRYGYVNLFVSCSAMALLICSVSKRCQFYVYVNLFGEFVLHEKHIRPALLSSTEYIVGNEAPIATWISSNWLGSVNSLSVCSSLCVGQLSVRPKSGVSQARKNSERR